eukprot:944319-Amphidinium_carterae.1
MGLYWDQASLRLRIAVEFLTRQDALEVLSTVLLRIWTFPSFVSSRWATVGVAARVCIAALATGFAHLHKFLLTRGQVTAFHTGAADRMQGEALRLCCIVAIIAYMPESLMTVAMKDGRVLQQVDAMKECPEEELIFVAKISDGVWEALQGEVEFGSQGSCTMPQTRRLLPWSLFTRDDPDAVAEEVLGLREPSPDTDVRQLQQLAGMGFSAKYLKEVLYMCSCVSFSSQTMEKQHASTSTLQKKHDLGVEQLCARAQLHFMRLYF